jgi:hypothetical protein
MKTIGAFFVVVGLLVGLMLVGFVAKIVFFPAHVANKEIQTGYDVVDKTLNADNAIYNYEWFKRQKESIDALNKKYENAQNDVSTFQELAGSRDKWTYEDKNEEARLRTISSGFFNQLKDAIAEYNARTKMANREIFQDGILPDFIDATTFIFKN